VTSGMVEARWEVTECDPGVSSTTVTSRARRRVRAHGEHECASAMVVAGAAIETVAALAAGLCDDALRRPDRRGSLPSMTMAMQRRVNAM